MKVLICFLMLSLFGWGNTTSTSKGEALLNGHIKRYSEYLKRTKDFSFSGIGGKTNEKIEIVHLCYDSKKKVNVEEARKLYISTVEGFINQLNEDSKMQPFLQDFPVTIKNIEIGIGFERSGFSEGECSVDYVCLIYDTISYAYYNFETKRLTKLYEEPYEVAKKIVLGVDGEPNS